MHAVVSPRADILRCCPHYRRLHPVHLARAACPSTSDLEHCASSTSGPTSTVARTYPEVCTSGSDSLLPYMSSLPRGQVRDGRQVAPRITQSFNPQVGGSACSLHVRTPNFLFRGGRQGRRGEVSVQHFVAVCAFGREDSSGRCMAGTGSSSMVDSIAAVPVSWLD
ncbi:hypothetical protein EXIGLDRAFT_200948 [Exidia glandulosa HHB12029]|uniref:Uncharacterized protein n=1 Tax=Exidia glandulosa HHB12029 TaxID=1314781 RepID=A0A165ES98_EXIGL|nr:hypothetical protein EXIGLDRAFT_200948 [Exidia glandulosa HHB12029]